MNRTRAMLVVLVFAVVPVCRAQIAGYKNFELVESTPEGTILDNPDIRNAHEVWLEMINGAKKSLDFEEFYVSNQKGEPLEDIIRAVEEAADRGVSIRFIVDARMYRTYPETVDSIGKRKNVAVRIIDYGKLAGGIQHAKYFIRDDEEVFLGSQNFDWRALIHIHELGLRISDRNAAAVYRSVFDLDWDLAEKNDRSAIAADLRLSHVDVPLRLYEGGNDTVVFTPTMSPKGVIPDTMLWDETQLVQLIDAARRDVLCQFLTYSPAGRGGRYYAALDSALYRAAGRGVAVKMIVADWSIDHPAIDYLKKLAGTPNIEVKYSAIQDWSGGYIPFARVEHCKYVVADSAQCWLGTSNAERSYFYQTRNVGVEVRNGTLTGLLRRIFFKSWEGPYTHPIKEDGDYTPRAHGEK